MTNNMLYQINLMTEMNETHREIIGIREKLIEYCKNAQLDMIKKTIKELKDKLEYLAIVTLKVYEEIPLMRDASERMLNHLKTELDYLNGMEKEMNRG